MTKDQTERTAPPALMANVGTGGMEDTLQADVRLRPPFRTVTRADVLEAVYNACPSLSRAQARELFEMALEELMECFDRNEPVKLRSFGSFCVRAKRGRIGRNPKTGVAAPITPRRVVTFKPSPVLIAMVNGHEYPRASE